MNNKLKNYIAKYRERIEGLYNLDTYLFLHFNLSPNLALNRSQLKFRFIAIYNLFKYKKDETINHLVTMRELFAQQRFPFLIKIELTECYTNLLRCINNKVVLEQIEMYLREFSDAIENNKPYDCSGFLNLINDLELRLKISDKFLRNLSKTF